MTAVPPSNQLPSNLSPTKRALLALQDLKTKLAEAERNQNFSQSEDIAIIGLGCRFPQARDPVAFWDLLHHGKDAITEIPASRWSRADYYDPNPDAPGKLYCPYGSFLDRVDEFDPQFFNISPREARMLDPQQRILLEVCWEALEQANQVPDQLFKTPTGVYIGIATSDYALQTLKNCSQNIDAYYSTGNALSIAAGRLSYLLGLTGPAISIDTACSSSLVAVHLACQSLQQRECNLALAGGVNLIFSPENSIAFSKARMLAPDGRCKTFDDRANGYVRGEGCGMVVLKRMKDAIADGDKILAVIRGSAINQDGPSGGLTVPNGPAQQAVIRQALTRAGVEPHQVQYVEAHGTGTALGDPIEIQALGAVYGTDRPQDSPLWVGAVKTNIGHLETAAGIAGLIKLVLSLNQQEIPAQLHFQTPSSKISWSDLPIRISAQPIPWVKGSQTRIAGLSSFGFSGTNAHLIVQEAPEPEAIALSKDRQDCPAQVLALSAKSQPALKDLVHRYGQFLEDHPELEVQDICFTANVYRARFKHRLAFTATSRENLQAQLKAWTEKDTTSHSKPPKIAFAFTGQGSQYSGMGQHLYQTQPLFRTILQRCAEILTPWLDIPLLELLYPALYPSNRSLDCLNDTRYTQPALFSVEYALAQLWISWGIQPEAVMGHSLGEYVAACVAGVFSLEEGLALIAQRAQLMDDLPRNGAMAAVLTDEKTVQAAISPYAAQVSIAAFNGPTNIVISGEKTAIAAVVDALERQEIKVHPLAVSHAFHSAMMEPMLAAFRQVAQSITYGPPQIPLISNRTGQRIGAEIATADYWVEHLRQPVQFAQSTALLLEECNTVIEMGPKPVLLGMVNRIAPTLNPAVSCLGLPSLRGDLDDWSVLLSSLGSLFVRGIDVDWKAIYAPFSPQRIAGLPTYPFQRQRYWFAQDAQPAPVAANPLSLTTPISPVMPFSTALTVEQTSEGGDRRSQILSLLRQEVGASLVGEGVQVDPDATFLELGADSINLAQTIETLNKTFEVKVTMRQFFEELTTLNDLAAYLDETLPREWEMPEWGRSRNESAITPITMATPVNSLVAPIEELQQQISANGSSTSVERILQEQLAVLHSVMSQQLDLLRQQSTPESPRSSSLSSNGHHPPNDNGSQIHNGVNGQHPSQRPPTRENPVPTKSVTPRRSPLTIQPQPDRKHNLPLSVAQKQMWWVEHWAADQNVYLIPAAVQIEGSINLAALEQSLNAVIARHESLRTSFHVLEGEPIQQVHPQRILQLLVKPMNGVPELAEIQQCVTQLCEPLFNLETDLLLRAQVLSWGDRHHVLVLVLHHLVGDGWSMGVLIREMLAFYPAFCKGVDRELPPLPIQYGDFALWEGQSVPNDRQQTNLAFWHRILQTAPTQLTLPTDYPRPAQATFRGQTHHQVFSLELSEALKSSSQSAGVTLFMLLLGAYSILLQRYSGQTDLLIGSTFAKRQLAETQPLIGLLLNTLVFRIDTSGNPTGEELLERVRQLTLDAFAHPEIPFAELARTLTGQERRTEWFQTMFILQSTPQPKLSLPDLDFSLLTVHGNSAKCDLSLWLIETPQGLRAEWEYNCNLFEAATLARMAEQYQQILVAMTQNLQQPLGQLMQLSASERTQLAHCSQVEPRGQGELQGELQPVFKGFEAQVQQTPEAIALEHEGTRWTYLTLNETANRIAHTLRAQGVSAEDLVGVCLPRSPKLIATLLGILKAGATYIPLDPTYPLERLHLMLEDAQVTALVTSRDLQNTLQLDAPIVLDLSDSGIDQQPTSNPNITVSLNQSAYIIYTSGSTGKPKGTLLNHKGLANFVREAIAQYGFADQDRVLQFASISFDAAVEEIYCTLCSGGTLVLRTDHMLSSSVTFCQSVAEQNLSVLDLPTAFWHRLTQDLAQGIATLPDSLRLVIIGGERVLPQTIQLWQQITQHRPIRLLNTYGPTEATVVATTYEITSQTQILPGMDVPIGKPLGNVQVYVLDADLQQVPLGVPGELYLGGDGLADGYLNRPELTAASFIPHPFQPTGKLYKTGDRVRMLPTGDLMYLGRTDDQVKVRGFRVELGEVERALQSHPGVREAVVIAQADAQGIQQLIGYVVLQGDLPPTQELRQFLQTQLPDYMVPALVMSLAQIPLTPAGKLDRRSLPQPQAQDWVSPNPYVAPRSATESELSVILSEILGVERVGVYDNFFSLGGHSLSAMQVLTRIRSAFGKEVSLRTLFAEPTVAALAAELEREATSELMAEITPIPVVDRTRPLPLSVAQQRLWLLERMETLSAAYHIGIRQDIQGQFDVNVLNQCLQILMARHESLRTTFHLEGDRPVQKIHPSLPLRIEYQDRGDLTSDLDQFASDFARQPFDLERGPLLRVMLIQVSAQQQVLLIVVHHIITDAWSIGVLIQEIMEMYPAILAGHSPQLPALPVQMVDFAQWQREWLQGEQLATQLNYWQHQLANAPTLLELPTDRPRPTVQSFNGQVLRVALPLALSQALDRLSQELGGSLYMTLLAGFGLLLHRYSVQPEILIGSPIANRNHPQIQGLIGFFLNTLVLRLNCGDNPTFQDFLRQVQQVSLDAYAHQDVPFEELLSRFATERHPGYSPWFQVMFILQNSHRHQLELPGLAIQSSGIDLGVAKFDLTLSMKETPNGLVGDWEYNRDLFDRSTIKRMAAQFEYLLSAIVDNPQQRLREVPLLPCAEQAVLSRFNQGVSAFLEPLQAVPRQFEMQVQQTPSAIALEHQETRWSYQTLNQKANQIAHQLRAQGVKSGDLVGVCLERSPDLIAALIGVLKVGAAYLPLDPTYPVERVQHMVDDAQVGVLITRSDLPMALQLKTLVLEISDPQIASQSIANLNLPVELTQTAYVIYTSGSTGKPKGTVLTHRGLANFTREAIAQYGFCPQDRVLQFASISFDAAVEEIYGTLCSGGTLILRTDKMLSSTVTFCETIAAQALTVLDLPTAFWHRLTQDLAQGLATLPDSLRLVIIGGERVLPQTLQLWQRVTQHHPIRLLNTYGPTEATVVATTYEITAQTQILTGMDVPIGRPLGNVQVYVLDAALQQVPLGVAGELYLGGDGLAAGYLNHPELTAASFIPHPFQPTGQLYKTGDRVRMLATGDLVYLGRTDDQVKVRGFRVELGEVERALQSHPAVRESAVIAQADAQGILQLIAYVVPEGTSLPPNELRQFLQTQLPDYMVPALVMSVAAIPLTPAGKLDRRSLPQPQAADWASSNPYVAPRTPMEAALTFIVAEVLGIERVGIHDDFFSLGGHSLSAMQVLARIRTMFGKEVSLRSLFTEPTVAALAAQLEQAESAEAGADVTAIARVDRTQPLALSFAQERLWFLNQFEGASATYNLPFALRLRGQVNLPAMEQCLTAMVERHESLRTTFAQPAEYSVQVIHTPGTFTIPVVDLTAWNCAERDRIVEDRIRLEAQQCFDLETGPLLRATLLQLQDSEQILLVTMHHIVSDAWSIGVFVQEIMALYPAYCRGQVPSIAPLPLQYADYAAWQRQQQQTDDFQERLEAWVQQFLDAPPLLELPTDYPRPAIQSFQGNVVRTDIAPALTQRLKSFGQQQQKTLFMTLLAAFVTLMHRYSRQSDLVVGTPIAGRTHPDLERLIGFFINTLPLRFTVESDTSFTALLNQVQTHALDAFANQDIPFGQLIERLPLERDLSYLPLCQTMFVLQNAPSQALQLPDLTLEPLPTHSGVARFDLTLSMTEVENTLISEWEYNSDLFDHSTIERMAAQFEILLESITNNPQQPISTIPFLSATERQTLLVDWNQTQQHFPQDECIHHLFENQAHRTPDAVAAVCPDATLTYRVLHQQSNQLAHYLQSQGIGANSLVGLSVERNSWMLIGLLGILKVGAAYVPLDPAFPSERLAMMVEDAQLSCLITQSDLPSVLPPSEIPKLCLDRDWPLIAQYIETPLSVAVRPTDLAYVIYTSGSTGKPKGVAVEHRNVVNFLHSMAHMPGMDATDILLSVTTLSFDIAGLELFLPLMVGAKVVLASRDIATDGMRLQSLLHCSEATVMQATPATWQMLLDAGWQGSPTLKVLCGGEALPVGLAKMLATRCASLWNLYGPTETTIWSLIEAVQAEDSAKGVSIGRPIANTQAYVLDAALQPLPIGIPGELFIGGAGVSRGYLNRPELTAERFIQNPFSQESHNRIYKTGDLVRYRPDRCLEFLGRLDNQIKLRGYRIELGEIESALLQHPAISQAVAVVREMGAGSQLLVAYGVSTLPTLTVTELQHHCGDRLPAYMVPSAFVLLDKLPLTPNGKVNRKALPAPQSQDLQHRDYVAPRNAIETQLAELWSSLLGITPIGIEDNFFELGGHSLLAMQLISRVRSQFQQDVSLRSLFENPTIAALALQLQHGKTLEALLISPVDRTQPLALSFSQQRLWFLHQLEGPSATYNLPLSIRLTGAINITALEQCFTEIVKRHESLRTNFIQIELDGIQVIHEESSIPIPVIDLTGLSETDQAKEIERQSQVEAQHPFDLQTEPLLRVKLLRLNKDVNILLATMHHIISDAWSMGIFVQEVMALYPAYCNAEVPDIEPLPIQYADYAAWQRQEQKSESFNQRLEAWAAQFMDAPPLLELPTDRPRPAIQTFQGGLVRVELSTGLTQTLKTFSQQHQKTLFMTLLGAFVTLMHRYSGQNDLVVGTPIAGRNHPDLERLIGFFINTLPLRFNVDSEATFTALLDRVQTQALDAFANQDIPFAQLIERLPLTRDLSYLPLCQTLFVLQNAPMAEFQLPGLTLEPLSTHSGVSRFDLTLSMIEADNTLIAEWEYNSDLFDHSTIERMAAQFEVLLASITSNPQQSIAILPLLPDAERQTLLVDWNQTQADLPLRCIHHWVEDQVLKTPDAIALQVENFQLSYQDLNTKVNQLAHYLQKIGVRPNTLVGICLEQSYERIVSMLAVLKAGGAYVPLDPAYPKPRLDFMLKDAQIQLLIIQPELEGKFSTLDASVETIKLSEISSQLLQLPCENPIAQTTPTDLAYVIYTSGSSGQPKGVMIEHKGLGNLAFAHINAFQVTPQSRVLQLASFSFDASVSKILMALCSGARLCLGRVESLVETQMASLIQRNAITHITMPPSTLSVLSPEQLTSVTHLTVAGEACSAEMAAKWSDRPGFYNAYGPTETTVCATIANCTGFQQIKPSIGRPIPNVQVYVLDTHLQPVPIGVPGELFIGGIGLARGYLNRPDLTKERFIPHPFSVEPGARLYRTGDLVRYLPDGQLDYLGRMDQQVKLRGFRIELEEIETVLQQQPEVKDAVIVVHSDAFLGSILVAYVVPKVASLTVPTLQQRMRDRLPQYMLPSKVVLLEALPLTPNGKVDRKALPVPHGEDVQREVYVAPRNEIEVRLVELWSSLLGISLIGVEDNFFALGGHSLLAIQLISRIQTEFQVKLQLQPLFAQPTIAQLAELILTEQLAQTDAKILEKLLAEVENLPEAEALERLGGISV